MFLDRELKIAARISFHPNVNTSTLTVAFSDFQRLLAECGNPVSYLDV